MLTMSEDMLGAARLHACSVQVLQLLPETHQAEMHVKQWYLEVSTSRRLRLKPMVRLKLTSGQEYFCLLPGAAC